jgi:putative heme-binding domain-containing protein
MQVQPHRNEDAFTVELVDKKVDLRSIGASGNYTIADRWPFVKEDAASKFGFDVLMGKLDDKAQSVKDTAGHFLGLLRDERSETKLDGIRAAAEKLQLEVAQSRDIYEVWLIGPMNDGETGFKKKRQFENRPIDLAATIKDGSKEYRWKKQQRNEQGYGSYIDFVKVYGEMDNSSVYAYFRLQASRPVPAQLMLGPDDSVKVFHNGDEVFSKEALRSAQQYEDNVTVNLTAGANDFLVRFHNVEGRSGSYLNYRAIGKTHLTLPDKPEGMSLAQRLASAAKDGSAVPKELLNVDWEERVKTADPVRGKRLFAGEALGCAKCHSASSDDIVTGGPSLAEAGKRFTLAYLVESILLPNQQVSPAFKSSLILDLDGNVVDGLVIEETKDSVTVMKSDTTRVTIAKEDIDEKKESEISAMPAGLAKTVDEVADVVAYLMQNK